MAVDQSASLLSKPPPNGQQILARTERLPLLARRSDRDGLWWTHGMRTTVFQALAEAGRTQEPVALGIISGVKGSSPQKVGAKALFYNDGRIQGTLGGGCLEAEIQHRAIASLRTGRPETFDLLLDHHFGWDDGLICGRQDVAMVLPHTPQDAE